MPGRRRHSHIPETLPCQGPGCTQMVRIAKDRRHRLARGQMHVEQVFCSGTCFYAGRKVRGGIPDGYTCVGCQQACGFDAYTRDQWRKGRRNLRCAACRRPGSYVTSHTVAAHAYRQRMAQYAAREQREAEVVQILAGIRQDIMQEMYHGG